MATSIPTQSKTVPPQTAAQANLPVTAEERYRMITEAAYFLAEKRGFAGGDMAQDWRQAEAQIDRMLREQGRLPNPVTGQIEQRVQEAFTADPATIAAQVRAITLDALRHGNLDIDAFRHVMTAVIQGAREGVVPLGDAGTRALKEAMRGLDEALAGAAEAAQLAIMEAAGRTKDFSQQGLRRAADDLATLQTLFAETLQDAARNTQGAVRSTFNELAEHARSSGSVVSERVRDALAQLSKTLTTTARSQVQKGQETLRHETALLAGLAAGLLQGIAARLQSKSDQTKH